MVHPNAVDHPLEADHPLDSVETPDCDFLSKLKEQNEGDVREAGSRFYAVHPSVSARGIVGAFDDSDDWSDYTENSQDADSVRDNFEIQGTSQEELDLWTEKAPEDQKLSSALASPQKPLLEASNPARQTENDLAALMLAGLVAEDANREGGDPRIAQQINQQLSEAMMSQQKSDTHGDGQVDEGDNGFAAQMLAGLMADANKQRLDPKASKNINRFVRRHNFFREQSLGQYTASQRRAFIRDVYDYARALNLPKVQARQATINARALCGEEAYNSDDSKLDEEEVDDSATFLARQHSGALPPLLALPAPLSGNEGETQMSARSTRKHDGETLGNSSSKRRKTSNEASQSFQDLNSQGVEDKLRRGREVQGKKQKSAAKEQKVDSEKNRPTHVPAQPAQQAPVCAMPQVPALRQPSDNKHGSSDVATKGDERMKRQRKQAGLYDEDDQDKSILRALRHYKNGRLRIDELKYLTSEIDSDRADLAAASELGKSSGKKPSTAEDRRKSVEEQADANAGTHTSFDGFFRTTDDSAVMTATDEGVSLPPLRDKDLKILTRELQQYSTQHDPPALRLRGGAGPGVEDMSSPQVNASSPNGPGDLLSSDNCAVPAQDVASPGDSCRISNGPSTPVKARPSSTDSSPLSSAPSNPRTPTPIRIVVQGEVEDEVDSPLSSALSNPCTPTPIRIVNQAVVEDETDSPLSSAPSNPFSPTPDLAVIKGKAGRKAEITPSTKRKRGATTGGSGLTPLKRQSSSKTSPYFLPSPKPPRQQVSCIPFPPLSSTSFGLVQESLSSNPFHLLIAVIFLNKTRGAVAMPVFYTFITRFPDPASLASAEQAEVVSYFQNLGLQNQRAKKCIALAKAWLEHPPFRGKRWRRLHYPILGDGKDIKSNEEPIADETEDPRVAWEVGHLPGIGAYGIDSWRIFCRDELRGLGTAALPALADADADARKKMEDAEMSKEWTRVLPTDKELRAYLRWRWLRLGWEWDPKTGERKKAEEKTVEEAAGGGVICEGAEGWRVESGKKEEEIRKMGDFWTELQSGLSALILPKLYSQFNTVNAHLKPSTLIISDLVREAMVSWYENRESGTSCGRVIVGADTEEKLAGEVVVGSEMMEWPGYKNGYRLPPPPPPPLQGYDLLYPSGPPAQYVLPPSLPRPSRRPPSLYGYPRHNVRHHGAPDVARMDAVSSSDTESDNDLDAELTLSLEQRKGKVEAQEFALILDDELQPPPRPRESVAPKLFDVTCYDVFHSTFTGETHGPGDTSAQLATTTGDTTRPQPEGSLFRWMYVMCPLY
ncbi:MAG: hypothetical protein LQ350_007541 [Teloschistes chrysophthalmus]|nr:MAG: hypothetical protein LQ350_007541 [Niorma chrysophthalma]